MQTQNAIKKLERLGFKNATTHPRETAYSFTKDDIGGKQYGRSRWQH